MHDDLDIEIDFDLPATKRGRRPLDLCPVITRELTEADIDLLNVPAATQPIPLKRISERHHALARMIAFGMKPGDAAIATDYGVARVSILQSDPAFQELVDFYRGEVDENFLTTIQHVSGLTRDSVLELRKRLEDEPEKFTNRELRELAMAMMDRAGINGNGELGQQAPRDITPEMSQQDAADEYARTLTGTN